MKEIIYKDKPIPLHYGMRTYRCIAEQNDRDLGEIISLAQQLQSDADSVINPNTAFAAMDIIVEATVVALNDGARRTGSDARYTYDDVCDMIDDDIKLLSQFSKMMFDSVDTSNASFTDGQNRPKNQVKKVPRKK